MALCVLRHLLVRAPVLVCTHSMRSHSLLVSLRPAALTWCVVASVRCLCFTTNSSLFLLFLSVAPMSAGLVAVHSSSLPSSLLATRAPHGGGRVSHCGHHCLHRDSEAERSVVGPGVRDGASLCSSGLRWRISSRTRGVFRHLVMVETHTKKQIPFRRTECSYVLSIQTRTHQRTCIGTPAHKTESTESRKQVVGKQNGTRGASERGAGTCLHIQPRSTLARPEIALPLSHNQRHLPPCRRPLPHHVIPGLLAGTPERSRVSPHGRDAPPPPRTLLCGAER